MGNYELKSCIMNSAINFPLFLSVFLDLGVSGINTDVFMSAISHKIKNTFCVH
jgi:hypothetical protein